MDTLDILVTSASGFVGRAVCRHLSAAGYRVRAAGWPAPLIAADAPTSITAVSGDLDRPDNLRAAVAGCWAIVHAGYADVVTTPAQLDRLLDAAERAGVHRFVQLSSIAAYGAATGIVDETHGCVPPVDAYGQAKIDSERRLSQWASAQRPVVVLRPGIVYGAGSPYWTDKIERRILAGAWGTFGRRGDGLAALVHVDDVASAVAAALATADLPAFLAVNITAPQSPTWNDYFASVATSLGVILPPIGAPRLWAMMTAALTVKVYRRLGGRGLEPWTLPPGFGELKLFSRRATYPSDLAAAMLGWRAEVELDAALAAIRARTASPSVEDLRPMH